MVANTLGPTSSPTRTNFNGEQRKQLFWNSTICAEGISGEIETIGCLKLTLAGTIGMV